MQAGLLARGFPAVYAMNITPPDGSISMQAMAEQVQVAVEGLLRSTGAIKVDIVAYSMGTLVVRYFLQRQGGCANVRRFISIAGPHRGTLTAYFRQNVGSRQMRPQSEFLRDLNSDRAPWGDTQLFSFWSPLDLMILPSVSSLLLGAHHRIFGVLIHSWMVSDGRVIEAVAHTLTSTG